MSKSKIYTISDEKFKEIIKENYSYSDCLRAIGLGTTGGHSTDVLKRRIKELNCSTEHFYQKNSTGWIPHKLSLEDVFAKDSCTNSSHTVRKIILRHNLLPYKCAYCGITEWAGKPISLQLHHENGIKTDNRLKNLKFLCPNCHAQTDNYGSKNTKNKIKKINNNNLDSSKPKDCLLPMSKRPSVDILIQLLKEKNKTEIGNMYGVTPTTVSRWMKYYDIESKSQFELIGENLKNEYLKGRGLGELSEEFKISKNTIRVYLKKFGFDFNGTQIPINIYDYETGSFIKTCKSIEETMRYFKYGSSRVIQNACTSQKPFKGCRLEYANKE